MPARKKLTKIILGAFLILFFTTSSVPAATLPSGFNAWPTKTTDNMKKTWTIKFNMPVNPATITSSNIYVTDANNQRVDTVLTPSPDGGTVDVTPIKAYTTGKEYRLFVARGLTSAKGSSSLSPQIVVPFAVARNNTKLILISNTSSSLLTNFTVVASPDVHSVNINQTAMHYQGNNTFTLGVTGLTPGNVVTVYAYDSSGQPLESKPYSVN